jgi:hypothetical protein
MRAARDGLERFALLDRDDISGGRQAEDLPADRAIAFPFSEDDLSPVAGCVVAGADPSPCPDAVQGRMNGQNHCVVSCLVNHWLAFPPQQNP